FHHTKEATVTFRIRTNAAGAGGSKVLAGITQTDALLHLKEGAGQIAGQGRSLAPRLLQDVKRQAGGGALTYAGQARQLQDQPCDGVGAHGPLSPPSLPLGSWFSWLRSKPKPWAMLPKRCCIPSARLVAAWL